LKTDPYELNNLAAEESHQKTKTRLSKELDHWMKQQGDTGMQSELSVKKHKTMQHRK
ncbi:MAG: heparan N-sulfatase, partial [Akkermansiaceae bacterium]|nr:heparan N-sulfatase [Akkermansiaceae bacterium]